MPVDDGRGLHTAAVQRVPLRCRRLAVDAGHLTKAASETAVAIIVLLILLMMRG